MFDTTKPQNYWVWENAVQGKIEANWDYLFPNNNVLWEFQCGTLTQDVALQVRTTHWTKRKITKDMHKEGTNPGLDLEEVLKGFFTLVTRHF